MKLKFIIVVLVTIAASFIFQPFARVTEPSSNIDPAFNYLFKKAASPGFSISKSSGMHLKSVGGRILVGSLIKTTDMEKTVQVIEDLGGEVKTKIETILTAMVPLDAVQEIAKDESVVYIEAGKQVRPKMNYARNNDITAVKWVQDGDGVGLDRAYNGSGVIVGIIDTGIDCGSADFKDADGNTRIIAFRDLSQSPVKDYTAAEIAAGDCTDGTGEMHGTHVAGIAASSNVTYKGVAPSASIVGVKLDFSSTSGSTTDDIVNAASYIFQIGQSRRQPVVINCSLGNADGAHDGKDLWAEGFDELINGKQGRAIVNAAGNENVVPGDDAAAGGFLGGIHATIDVPAGTNKAFEIFINSIESQYYADIWMPLNDGCSVGVDIYDASDTTKSNLLAHMIPVAPASPAATSSVTYGGVTVDAIFLSNYTQHQKQHAQVIIDSVGGNPLNYAYDLIFYGGTVGCSGTNPISQRNAWLNPDSVYSLVFTKNHANPPGGVNPNSGGYTYVNGDSNYTITIPATGNYVLAAASFSARDIYTDIDDNPEDQSIYDPTANAQGWGTVATGITVFSSLGPGAGDNNTNKPDITAPGEPIISTLASTYNETNRKILGEETPAGVSHVKEAGTSMASPFVAGVVALMFERDGCMTPAQVKTYLQANATPAGGGLLPYTWGAGKVNGLASVAAVALPTPYPCQPDNPDPTPAASSGCSLIRR